MTTGFKLITNRKTRKAIIKIGNMTEDVQEAIAYTFEYLGSSLVRTAQNQILNDTKKGRVYPRYEDGKRLSPDHQASAPGETPALLSGDYFDGFGYESREMELEFGNTVEYAEFLEDGTENMEPRPGVMNAVERSVIDFRTNANQNILKALDIDK